MKLINIREASAADAEDFLNLCKQLDKETKFMLLEPAERSTTVDQQENRIQSILDKRNQVIFVAEASEKLVGYVAGMGGSYHRNRHKADLIIGILQTFTGKGLGTRLLETVENWAREAGLHKLELTVMAHNERAIKLYRKMGFTVEGISVDSLLVDGRYVDELDMAKILTLNPLNRQ